MIDGLRKLKRFSPANVNSNRAQNFVGRWMRPDQSTALHASLVSLAHNV